jgi:hypothetical protein
VPVVASLMLACTAVAVYAACGFDGTPSGVLPLVPADASSERAPVAMGEGDAGADGQSAVCPPERTTCGTVCTDLKADPQNCNACGTKCAELQTCDEGRCTVLCVNESLRCNDTCIDPQTDRQHCGSCTTVCGPTLLCSAGKCAPDCGALATCPVVGAVTDAGTAAVYCADTMTDGKNCGACGTACKVNQTCQAGTCKDVCTAVSRVGDIFGANMVGCIHTALWTQRAQLCPAGSKVCSAAEWVQRRGTKKPTYDYWTDDDLKWSGKSNSCAVSVTTGNFCDYGTPMRVCSGSTDPLGNQCNWTDCGFGTTTPNQYFGGCSGDTTAGALCCTP